MKNKPFKYQGNSQQELVKPFFSKRESTGRVKSPSGGGFFQKYSIRHRVHQPVLQRFPNPAPPFEGVISTRFFASLRRTAGRTATNLIRALPRNARVSVVGNSGKWLEVRVTVNGEILSGFVWEKLISQIPAGGVPAASPQSRREALVFGTFNVYPDSHRGAIQAGGMELYEAEFKRIETAWTRVNDNSGGLKTNGSATDVAEMRRIIGEEMARSLTFRNLIIELTEDSANSVTINAGRNNSYWLDEFGTNNSDLRDLEYLDETPRARASWVFTRGEDIVHWLVERRHDVMKGGTGNFAPAHAAPMDPGGMQQQYRADQGQSGRTTDQFRSGPARGLHTGKYRHSSGAEMHIKRDGTGGAPTPYEIEYLPAGGGASQIRRNRMVASLTSNNASSKSILIKILGNSSNVSSPVASVSSTNALSFRRPLGDVVPVGGNIQIKVVHSGWMYNSILGTLNWAHPFDNFTGTVSFGGTTYTLNIRLQMDP